MVADGVMFSTATTQIWIQENQNFLLDSNAGKKKYETQYHPGTTSFGMSVFNLSNAIVGSGILGLSYAMANTGIALFVILLLFVSIVSLYSVHLLLKTANEGGSLLYEQLGMKAFGMAGKLAASGSITMQNIGAMSSYLFIVKYELPLVIKTFMNIEENTGEWYLNGDYLVLLVSVILILPLSLLKNLGYLGYTSGFSLLCMVFFLIVVIWKMFQIPCPMGSDLVNMTLINATLATPLVHENISDDACKPKYFIFNSQTVYAVPILTFSFVCHPAILPIYEELKGRSRKRMMNVSYVSFFAMFLMYLLAALFGYLTFYGNVESELLHTYSAYLGPDVLLLTCASRCTYGCNPYRTCSYFPNPQFHYPATMGRERVQLVASLFYYNCSSGIYQCACYLRPYYSRHLWIHWCICSCHADLYSAFCLLYQTSEEGTNEVSAKDWGCVILSKWYSCDDWVYDADYSRLDP
uniref:Sodium-coupled neutral amino acid symporter 2 n=2 Tax=Anas platyrhynchos TaxID=8839 RepID=A0A8B9SYV7_ANAPL